MGCAGGLSIYGKRDPGFPMEREIRYLSAGDNSNSLLLKRNFEYSVYVQSDFYTLLYCVKQMLNGYPQSWYLPTTPLHSPANLGYYRLQRQLPETRPLHTSFPVLVQSPIVPGETHTR